MIPFFHIAAWCATLFQAAAGSAAVLAVLRQVRLHRPAALLLAALAGLATAGTLAIGSAIIARAANVNIFGLICLAYLCVAVVPPAIGLALFFGSRREKSAAPVRWSMLVLLLLPAPICAYASFVEPYWLEVERHALQLPDFPQTAEPLRIAILADVQTTRIGPHERHARATALAEAPDLIVFPGDLIQVPRRRYADVADDFSAWLREFDAPGGVYACLGNVDPASDATEMLIGGGVTALRNAVTVTTIRGLRVAIGGVDFPGDDEAARQTVARLAQTPADVRLLLGHTPDVARFVAKHFPPGAVDLVISGHTHGGQVALPGFGPPLRVSKVSRRVAAGGLHDVNGQRTYVSRGVGYERDLAPPVRFLCRPEVSLLTISGTRE